MPNTRSASSLIEDPKFVEKVDRTIERYPRPETALLPALHLCQSALRYVPEDFQVWIAERLGMSPAHVRGVVTFYEMFTEQPLGRYLFQVCKTLPCMLAGSEALLEHLQEKLGIEVGQTSSDGKFSLIAVECLACCDGGPALMINEMLYRNISFDELDEILGELE